MASLEANAAPRVDGSFEIPFVDTISTLEIAAIRAPGHLGSTHKTPHLMIFVALKSPRTGAVIVSKTFRTGRV